MSDRNSNLPPAMAEIYRQDAEIKELRQQLEQSQARVAELEDLAVEAAQLFEDVRQGEYTVDSFTAQPYKSVQINTSSKPWLLRKQAEAVEAMALELRQSSRYGKPAFNHGMTISYAFATGYTQRLRWQADELEQK